MGYISLEYNPIASYPSQSPRPPNHLCRQSRYKSGTFAGKVSVSHHQHSRIPRAAEAYQLLEIPRTDLHVAVVVVQALGEVLGVGIAVGRARLALRRQRCWCCLLGRRRGRAASAKLRFPSVSNPMAEADSERQTMLEMPAPIIWPTVLPTATPAAVDAIWLHHVSQSFSPRPEPHSRSRADLPKETRALGRRRRRRRVRGARGGRRRRRCRAGRYRGRRGRGRSLLLLGCRCRARWRGTGGRAGSSTLARHRNCSCSRRS